MMLFLFLGVSVGLMETRQLLRYVCSLWNGGKEGRGEGKKGTRKYMVLINLTDLNDQIITITLILARVHMYVCVIVGFVSCFDSYLPFSAIQET